MTGANETTVNWTDVELIASVISDGRCGQDAIRRADSLLKGYGSARMVLAAVDACGQPVGRGLTKVQRRRLADARELARRLLAGEIAPAETVATPKEVARWASRVAFCREEVLMVVGLDARNRIAGSWEIARGWEAGINVHPRQIFSLLVRESVGRCVLVHNHPSGNPEPSDEDIRFTASIIDAGRLLGVDVLDHVVVASGGFFSMRADCRNLEFGRLSG
jgi:DNA repair protein RadC